MVAGMLAAGKSISSVGHGIDDPILLDVEPAQRDDKGWILVEASTEPADKIAAMKEQVTLFNEMMASLK
jgi:hypothetical protein